MVKIQSSPKLGAYKIVAFLRRDVPLRTRSNVISKASAGTESEDRSCASISYLVCCEEQRFGDFLHVYFGCILRRVDLSRIQPCENSDRRKLIVNLYNPILVIGHVLPVQALFVIEVNIKGVPLLFYAALT